MRRSQRLIATAVLLSLVTVLAGCSSDFGSDFDPSSLFDWMDTKKKLPGQREPVFPDGVPGMEQGVPKELYKGAVEQQERQDEQAEQAAAAAPATPPAGEQGKGEAAKPGAQTAAGQPAVQGESAPPPHHPHKKKVVRKRAPKPPPSQSAAQQAGPALAPAAAPAAQPAQSSAPFPAPLPSGSFSR